MVMDEADQLLSTGYKAQINEIIAYLPKVTCIAMFSVFMPNEVLSQTK